MDGDRAVVERILAAGCAVDELVTNHEIAGLDIRLEAAHAIRPDNARDPELLHGIDVCAVGDNVRRILMVLAVPWQERDMYAVNLGDRNIRRWSIGCIDSSCFSLSDQLLKAGAADQSYSDARQESSAKTIS